MYARQCLSCGVIDGRTTFHDENEARADAAWTCEHCGAAQFEAVLVPEEEPVAPVDDVFE
ncbi:MAG TPA: hypothetical protein VGC71_02325 [Gaiellales bacterium]